MRLLLTEAGHALLGPRLAEVAPGVTLLLLGADGHVHDPTGRRLERDEVAPTVAWASAELWDGPARPFFGICRRADSLRWMQVSAAGVDDPVFAELLRRGVRLTTVHIAGAPIAEYVLAEVLAHAQRLAERRAAQASAEWAKLETRELNGSTWVVVGLGDIGTAVATRARAFGAHVVGVRRTAGAPPAGVAEVVTPGALVDVLPHADVVVLAAPATAATRHLLDAPALAALRPGGVVVNVGRGSLVDEDALLAALDDGRVGHAVLDVFETEPLPADHPFWRHPRVVVSAHSSARGAGRFELAASAFLENLRRWHASDRLLDEVTDSGT